MIKENILEVRERITGACLKDKRDPRQIAVIAVTKSRLPAQIKEAIDYGITDIGENRIQEAAAKYQQLMNSASTLADIKWHMVGHLQTNKTKEAVRIFDLIHSVDTLRLVREIDREAGNINKVQNILIQINVSGEASKFGIKPEEAGAFIKEAVKFSNVQVRGLMTIAPIVGNPEEARPCFRLLREIRDNINKSQITTCVLEFLSMGMSDDFEVAVQEGSNMVRIGRAIFEG